MKVFVVTQADLDRLRAFVDRAPEHGYGGGSSQVLNATEREAHDKAHRFFNFQLCRWIDEVVK